MRGICIGTLTLFAVSAWGQDVTRTYHFANITAPSGFSEVVNIFRTIGDLRDVSVDATNATLLTHGTADQMALTDWLFPELDRPPATPSGVDHSYQMAGTAGVVRVFHFAHASSSPEVQEIVNVVRTAADIQRVFPLMSSKALVTRGTTDQVALVDWLVSEMDVAGPTPGVPVQAHQFAGVIRDSEVRVAHLSYTKTPQAIQELTNTVRTIADMNRVFPVNAPDLLVFRGDADSVALAEWLVSELDQPAGQPGPAPNVQQLTARWDPVARVFYLAHATSPAAVQEIVNSVRAQTHVTRIYPCNAPKALALRGSADQVTAAANLIAQLDR